MLELEIAKFEASAGSSLGPVPTRVGPYFEPPSALCSRAYRRDCPPLYLFAYFITEPFFGRSPVYLKQHVAPETGYVTEILSTRFLGGCRAYFGVLVGQTRVGWNLGATNQGGPGNVRGNGVRRVPRYKSPRYARVHSFETERRSSQAGSER